MIRAVLFDADGVVQSPSPGWRPALEALAPSPADAETLLADIFAVEQLCTDGTEEFAAVLIPVLEKWQIDIPPEQVLDIWTMIEPCEPNLSVVADVRDRGILTCLATNQQQHRAAHIRQSLGYDRFFDHLCISCELGAAKPSALYFQRIADMLSLSPSEMAFIDDHPRNVESARAVGLRAECYVLTEGSDALMGVLDRLGVPA